MKVARRALRLFAVLMMLSALLIGGMTVYAAGGKVMATAKTNTKKAKITWNKVADADRYLVYYAKCGNKLTKKKQVSSSKTTYTFKNLKKNTCYKVKVVAQKKESGKYKKISSSYVIHFVTTNSKYITNPRKINIKKTKLSVTEGDIKVLQTAVTKAKKGKSLLEESHAAKVRYFSTDSSVATVNSLGMVTGKSEGTCKIYAVAVNGLYDSIDITVKAGAKEEKADETTEYEVTYKYTGDVPKDAPAVPAAAKYAAGSTVKAAAVPSVEGYTFTGWVGEVDKMPKHDVTVMGVWKQEKYTLSYSVSGDVPDDFAVPQPEKYAAGEKVSAVKVSVPKGYEFSGWKTVPTTMPAKNVTLSGKFSRKSYTLTIQYTGLSAKSVPEEYKKGETVEYKFGDKVTLPKNAEKGYKFCGWDKTVKTMPAEDVTVTGTWKKVYTLTYMLYNDGYFRYYEPSDYNEDGYYYFNVSGQLVETKTQEFVEGEGQALYTIDDFDITKAVRLIRMGDYLDAGRYDALIGWYILPYPYYSITEYQMSQEILPVTKERIQILADYFGLDIDVDKVFTDKSYNREMGKEVGNALNAFYKTATEDEIAEYKKLFDESDEKLDAIYDKYDAIDPEAVTSYTLTDDMTVYGFLTADVGEGES